MLGTCGEETRNPLEKLYINNDRKVILIAVMSQIAVSKKSHRSVDLNRRTPGPSSLLYRIVLLRTKDKIINYNRY